MSTFSCQFVASLLPTNHRLQFSLRSLLVGITVCCLVCAVPSVLRRWRAHDLEEFIGSDFRKLDETRLQEALDLVKSLIPQSGDEDPFDGFWTWYVWRDNASGDLIVFQADIILSSGERSYGRIFVLDRAGTVVKAIEFTTGKRIQIKDASFAPSADGKSTLIVKSTRRRHGRDICEQYYRYSNRSLELTRLVDSKGVDLPLGYVDEE